MSLPHVYAFAVSHRTPLTSSMQQRTHKHVKLKPGGGSSFYRGTSCLAWLMLRYAMLCHAILVLHHATSCYAMPSCAILCHANRRVPAEELRFLEHPNLAMTHWSQNLFAALQTPASESGLRWAYLRRTPQGELRSPAQCAGEV